MNRPASSREIPVLMAGVVPPPVHGMSLATRGLFDADLAPLRPVFLEIRSSRNLEDVGKGSFGKLLRLLPVLWRLIWLRFAAPRPKVMYYTPGSAAMVPFFRDVVVLGLARCLYRRVVLHYHSGGLPDFLAASKWRAWLGRMTYGRGAWAVALSSLVPVPGRAWGTAREFEVPNGLDVPEIQQVPAADGALRLLFVGNLFEDKGIFDLLEAAIRAAACLPRKVRLILVGAWPDQATKERFDRERTKAGDNLSVELPGPLFGADKWRAFADADVFVFPTYYRSENLPLVLIEALAAGLPVISTRWRGVPTVVADGECGLLVEPRDAEALAAALVRLGSSPARLAEFAANARERYHSKFTQRRQVAAIIDIMTAAASE